MEDQTQVIQPTQGQPADSTQVDTSITQPESTPVEQTPTDVAVAPSESVVQEPKKLTGADVLASYGLVEIYDARLGAFCQVKKEDAQKMLDSLDSLRTALGV